MGVTSKVTVTDGISCAYPQGGRLQHIESLRAGVSITEGKTGLAALIHKGADSNTLKGYALARYRLFHFAEFSSELGIPLTGLAVLIHMGADSNTLKAYALAR